LVSLVEQIWPERQRHNQRDQRGRCRSGAVAQPCKKFREHLQYSRILKALTTNIGAAGWVAGAPVHPFEVMSLVSPVANGEPFAVNGRSGLFLCGALP
jgi:hypothetical protein